MNTIEVPASEEFRRIASIPRRDPSELLSDELRLAATRALRRVGADGSREFRAIQSGALIATARAVELGSPGSFLPIGVGKGKTDITFCLPCVLQASRAVLTVPGSLTSSKPTVAGKTERDFAKLREHWLEVPYGQILSYERLGRAGGDALLEMYEPDLIVSDEAHALRNIGDAGQRGASCARVVYDYVRARRKKGFRVLWVVLSGTVTGGSLKHYAHLAELTLGPERTFLPIDEYDLDFWRRAVDAEVEAGGRVDPGALLDMPHEAKGTRMQRARTAIRKRMHETEGVIASTDTGVQASLRLMVAPEVVGGVPEERWHALRKDWLKPNGEQCLDAFEYHRTAREYALGYWSDWDPPPPPEWRKRRKAWAKEVHAAISERLCNTEVEARALLDSPAWHAWEEIRGEYDPEKHRVTHWLSDATLEACAAWAKRVKRGGIIWTQHIPVGERLERDFGIPYYRDEGFDSRGVFIEDATEGVIVASIQANGTGKNLQHRFFQNLVVSPYGSAERNEQKIGRTHRESQPSDCVTVEFLISCVEHVTALRRAKERAQAIEQLTKNPQRLAFGDWIIDLGSYKNRPGSQWRSKIKDEDDDEEDSLFNLLTEGLT
jgi:hypothetical protein